MSHAIRVAAVIATLNLVTGHWSPVTAQQVPTTSITIYQDSRILVRRSFAMRIPAGASTQRIALGNVDPASIISLDSSVVITGATTTPGVDADAAFRRAIGRSIVFRSGSTARDTVSAVVLGVDPVRLRLVDGSIVFWMPGQPTFPADLVPAEQVTELRLNARRATERLSLGGFASEGGWTAMYGIVLRGGMGQVTGLASFTSPFTAEDVEVQLLAGQVNQAPTPQGPMAQMRMRVAAAARSFEDQAGNAAGEQKVGEFHLYTLPGRHLLRPGTMTSVALFEPATAATVKTYELRTSIPFIGYWGQTGDEGETPISVFYTLTRTRRTPFGDTPLPGGAARIFQADSAGRLQLIGEAGIGHTAAGEALRINAGNAFDLVAKRTQTSYETGQEPIPGMPRRTRTFVNAAYADTLRNQGDAEATIDLFIERGGEWRVVESSLPAERLSSTKQRIRVKVPAQGETVVTYRIRTSW